jgi:fructose-bisphosphate aldolase class II
VKLRLKVLKECQDAVVKTYGEAARFYLVFYGGSGSTQEEIHEALDYGVVKMNIDTDMQYAFTRAVAGQMFKNDDGVLKVDGEVGNKKAYDPRSYLALVFRHTLFPQVADFSRWPPKPKRIAESSLSA